MVIINSLGLRELKTAKFCGYKNTAGLGLVLVYEHLTHEELTGHLGRIWWCCLVVKFVAFGHIHPEVKELDCRGKLG